MTTKQATTTTTSTATTAVKPFMVYMGGKRKMLKHIRPNVPDTFANFHEAFLGAGAVALDILAQHDALTDPPARKFFLSDYSADVVDAWNAVKDYPHELAELLESMLANHSCDYFKAVLHWDRDGLLEHKSVLERGARFIYVMQTCFGAAIKTTKDGWMNMSYGYDCGRLLGFSAYDYENMFAVSALLNRHDVTIFQASYEAVLDNADYGDLVYLDPPYETTADGGGLLSSRYVVDGIDHRDVRAVIDGLGSKGAMVLMSNSDTAVTRDLYAGWACIRPSYFWAIGGAGKEGQELMVANWRLADRLASQVELAA